MTIKLGTLEFEKYPGLYVSPPIDGLFLPPIRTDSGNLSGRDGGWISSQFLSGREIVLNLSIGRSCSEMESLMCAFNDMVKIRESIPFIYTTKSGTSYYADVYVIDMRAGLDSEMNQQVQLTLLAPDPYLYIVDPNDPDVGWITRRFEQILGGGYVTPYVLPVEWAPSAQPTIINNPTDMLILPQIILEGTFTNPRVINDTTGEYIELNVTTSPGDKITIDMKDRIVTLNGGSILPTMSGSWWGLVSGDNYISLLTSSSLDDKDGLIRYRPGYKGVYDGIC